MLDWSGILSPKSHLKAPLKEHPFMLISQHSVSF